jgi:cobalt transporter subunit CbtA
VIFSRIIYGALLVGLASGVLSSVLQIANLDPIIFAAESYQRGIGSGEDAGYADGAHEHAESSWTPARGLERSAYTFLANVLVSTGFAAVMLALMKLYWLTRRRAISWSQGSLWGLAGYAALFLAPALGVTPEIPGLAGAPLQHRQVWWLLTALSAATGLGILAFAPMRLKILGLLLLAAPYLIGAPQVDAPAFHQRDPQVAQALVYLQQQFVIISAITNLVFWLVLGLACRYSFNRWIRNLPT